MNVADNILLVLIPTYLFTSVVEYVLLYKGLPAFFKYGITIHKKALGTGYTLSEKRGNSLRAVKSSAFIGFVDRPWLSLQSPIFYAAISPPPHQELKIYLTPSTILLAPIMLFLADGLGFFLLVVPVLFAFIFTSFVTKVLSRLTPC